MTHRFRVDVEMFWKIRQWMNDNLTGPHSGHITVGQYGVVECEKAQDAVALRLVFSSKIVPI